MKQYIFLTYFNEEFDDNSDFPLASFVGLAKGNNENEAFENLRKTKDYLGYSGDDEHYVCYESANREAKYFNL